jgi:ParB family chromosome partitioning protein
MGSANKLAAPEPVAEKGETIRQVSRANIVPSPLQPRKVFRPEELIELVDSIKERGVIQPLIVRLVNGKYELIAGERRWRAAGEAGLETLPVIVREASNRDVLELALIENLQRADLSPIEEAEAYARLMKEFTLTQEQVAQQVGKGRAVIANAVRLLTLPEQIRAWIASGDLSVGHAKVLLGLEREEEQLLAAERIRKENLTVRATERLIESMRAGTKPATKRKAAAATSEAIFADLEKRLQQHVGTRVRIVGKANAGKIEIQYFSPEDLDRILTLLRLPSG